METRMDATQYLTFTVGEDHYALAILRLREIIQYGRVTRIPRAPEWIRGVINLRGSVVPVVDQSVRFGLPASVPTPSTCIVITEVALGGETVVMGLVTDSVREVVHIHAADVQPAPAFGTRARIEFLSGVAHLEDRLVLILDVDRLLTDLELATLPTLDSAPTESPVGVEAQP